MRAKLSLIVALIPITAAVASDGLSSGEHLQAMRLLEYESLLATPLPAPVTLCMDDLLASRWPRADAPSPQQWRHMLDQAREAHEQCVSPPAETDRSAKAIRQAMERQVARQRAMEDYLARLRVCAALPPGAPVPPSCQSLRRPEVIAPAQWERISRAIKLGLQ